MIKIPHLLAEELSITLTQVENVLQLFEEGGTIPFIARYRKERTGEMNEIVLRDLEERFTYLTELAARKETILKSIEEQGKLTDELRMKIEDCLQKTDLEDLYLPYKPKKRTRATVAREKGLGDLAEFIKSLNTPGTLTADLDAAAQPFLNEERGVLSIEDALAGASDILAEEISEQAHHRAHIREFFLEQGIFTSKVKDEYAVGTTKFEMYREYKAKVKEIAPHNMLALRRGETEGVLTFDLIFDETVVENYLESENMLSGARVVRDFYKVMLKDAFERLMKFSLITDVRVAKKLYADVESIRTFETNLRELLLSSPAGMKPTLGVDPGFRTGCKVVAVDETGAFLEYQTVFPHQSDAARMKAGQTILDMVKKHKIELIAIGNGTAGRETEEFIGEVISTLDNPPTKVMVNESGASVYSASPVAIEEFPDQDLTVRGAVSIGRRLQDPLAELVKIDPKSIGVGQYQHDVDQKLLKKKLEETVESCVNFVGVDLNTASSELLSYVAGITKPISKNIITYRNEHGVFRNRKQLLDVPKFGPKTFEQAAGFLRIRSGDNPLDNSAVHPESYEIAESIIADLAVPFEKISEASDRLKSLNLKKYISEKCGEPTLRDIIAELQKPGRDPREKFHYASFKEGVTKISDLATGMQLEGVVTNVANFGAFVDIGVHQDGLVHVSQLADRFIKDPSSVVKVGQVVKVTVLEVNEQLNRISLTMKSQGEQGPKEKGTQIKGSQKKASTTTPKKEKSHTLADLKAKFNTR